MYTETVVKFTVKISFNDLIVLVFEVLWIWLRPDSNYLPDPDPVHIITRVPVPTMLDFKENRCPK